MTKPKKPRKPMPLKFEEHPDSARTSDFKAWVNDVDVTIGEEWRENDLDVKEARRLAKWLNRAADHLEAKEKKS